MKNTPSNGSSRVNPAGKNLRKQDKDNPGFDEHHDENRSNAAKQPKEQDQRVPKEEGE